MRFRRREGIYNIVKWTNGEKKETKAVASCQASLRVNGDIALLALLALSVPFFFCFKYHFRGHNSQVVTAQKIHIRIL